MNQPGPLKLKYYLLLSCFSLGFLLLAISQLIIGDRIFRTTDLTVADSLNLNLSATTLSVNSINQQNIISTTIQTELTLDLLKLIKPTPSNLESKVLGWFVKKNPETTIHSDKPIQIFNQDEVLLLEISLIKPFILPLSTSTEQKIGRTTTQIEALIHIISPELLPKLLTEPTLNLSINIRDLDVNPINGNSWFKQKIHRLTQLSIPHLKSQLTFKLPKIPPQWSDPSKLLNITSYEFYPIPNSDQTVENDNEKYSSAETVGIRASVTTPNPILEIKRYIKDLHLDIEVIWNFPLSIFLLQQQSTGDRHQNLTKIMVPLASATTDPFTLNDSLIDLNLSIHAILLPSSTSQIVHLHSNQSHVDQSQNPLTEFLNKFLKGKENQLVIRYRSPNDDDHQDELMQFNQDDDDDNQEEVSGNGVETRQLSLLPILDVQNEPQRPQKIMGSQSAPEFITAFLRLIDLPLNFPGAPKDLELVTSIEVQRMKIDLVGLIPPNSRVLCSGELRGIVNLPPQLSGLTSILKIIDVTPNIILIDGPLPNSTISRPSINDEEEYPENGFARLLPDTPLPATLTPLEKDPRLLLLNANFVKVPLHILEGRSDIFRRYAAKYMLHHRKNLFNILKDDNDQDPPSGVLTSILGGFGANASLANSFDVQLINITIHGSFYV
ncbi:hypothetical protein MJO28_008583 [Puccinia striiformis f. sp. tritici]|uniref:Uncharacterized protein n=3 Tax=Puccinia striiformis TaxID=27350 RepID=A0A2S4UQS6_9BASI